MEVFGESLREDAADQAARAERDGFDGVVAVDHFYSTRGSSPPRWRVEPLVSLGAAAATTSRIRLAAMVMNVNFHHPAVLAHAMASLDVLSRGRAELGLGSGWYGPEHTAFGLPWDGAPSRTERLLEAATVCRAMLRSRGVVEHHGSHFHVENTVPWQWAAGDHAVPVVIGGAGENMLCRAAEIVDRVDLLHANRDGEAIVDEIHSRSKARVEKLLAAVHASAGAAGNAVKVSATLTAVVVSPAEAGVTRERLAPSLHSSPALLEGDLLYVVGSQDELLVKLGALASLGVDRVHVIPAGADHAHTLSAVHDMLPDIHRL